MSDNNESQVYPSKEQFDAMSDNQKKFVASARRQKLVMREYSGRGMFGRVCPAVVVSPYDTTKFAKALNVSRDNMGRDMVIYCSM